MKLSASAQIVLKQIEQECQQQRLNLTAQRRHVLLLMLEHNKMISAYDLLEALRKTMPQAKPVTVYRALAFLLQHHFIHKVESTNSYIICSHFNQFAHLFILMICKHCHAILEEESAPIEALLTEKAQQRQFKVQHRLIEIQGICHQCQAL